MSYRLLVIRFSALGDVAMTIPALKQLAYQYPELQISMLSNSRYAALFDDMPDNIHFLGAELKGRYKGLCGLNNLLKDINYQNFDAVADLHNVIRSRYIDFRLKLTCIPVVFISKNRLDQHRLTRFFHKQSKKLPTVFERQQKVFYKLGFKINLKSLQSNNEQKSGIGIAPFAAHKGKIYPIEKMEEVIAALSSGNETIYLFGAGTEENRILQQWTEKYDNVVNTLGQYTLQEEMRLMSHLRIMLTMDSGNMHLASAVGTRVVSIWGATHPHAGFLGYNQDINDCIQQDLPCRPCSVYGNKKCRYGDYHCMTDIDTNEIIKKLQL